MINRDKLEILICGIILTVLAISPLIAALLFPPFDDPAFEYYKSQKQPYAFIIQEKTNSTTVDNGFLNHTISESYWFGDSNGHYFPVSKAWYDYYSVGDFIVWSDWYLTNGEWKYYER